MRIFRPEIAALALCLAGCGAELESEGAGEAALVNAGAGKLAAAGTPQAPAGNATAETPGGPCPFATRGWEATIMPAAQPGEKATVALNGEARPDKDGRMPMISTQGEMRPPALVLELSSDLMVEPQADRGWMAIGGVFGSYGPEYTHAAVRCAGAEIARVEIRPAQ